MKKGPKPGWGPLRLKRWQAGAAVAMGLIMAGSMSLAPLPPAQALENNLALTPPMGWNSWNQVRCNGLNEDLVKATADAMASNGMAASGYDYVVVDDCWQGGRGDDGVLFSHPTRFPSGMQALGAYIHSKGLKFGIYGVPGSETCANFWDSYPIYGLGSLNHEQQDADTFAAWGVDYLKYDWCRADETDQLARPAAFAKMRDALKNTGRDIVYGISEYGVTQPWTWGKDIANLWRTTHDIAPNWASISGIINDQAALSQYGGPGGWNDPDMLQVGNGNLTDAENRSHFGLWSMLSAPLFAGTDLTQLGTETLKTITNAEVIAVNQDTLGKQAVRMRNENGIQVWAKELAGGDIAVALFNTTETEKVLSSSVSEVKGSGEYSVRSLWDKKDVMNTASVFSATVPRHGTAMLRLTPGTKPGLPSVPEVKGNITLEAGSNGTMSVGVRNGGNTVLTGASLAFTATAGLTLPTTPIAVPDIAAGGHITVKVAVSAARTAAGNFLVPTTLTAAGTSFTSSVGVNVLLPANAYVSDLPWTGSTNGWGPVERDKAVGDKAEGDGPAIKLGGVTYPKGLGTNSPASVTFNVGGQCTAFRAVIGMDDDVIPRAIKDDVTPRSTFEVYADGVQVYNKIIAQGIDAPAAVNVDITGASVIELRNNTVGAANTATWHAWADWADAKLDCGVTDAVAPTVVINSNPSANATGWWNKPVVLSVEANDDRGGSLTVESRIGDAGWTPYTRPVTLSEDGIHHFQARASDAAGNISEPAAKTIRIDATGPVISLGSSVEQKTITAEGGDALSGLASLEYMVDGSELWEPYIGPVVVAEGVPVRFQATDAAGNTTIKSAQWNAETPASPPATGAADPDATPSKVPTEMGNTTGGLSSPSGTTIGSDATKPSADNDQLADTGTETSPLVWRSAAFIAALGASLVAFSRLRIQRLG